MDTFGPSWVDALFKCGVIRALAIAPKRSAQAVAAEVFGYLVSYRETRTTRGATNAVDPGYRCWLAQASFLQEPLQGRVFS